MHEYAIWSKWILCLKNFFGQKEPKDWQTFKMFEQATQVDKRLSIGSRLSLQLKS